MTSAFAPAALSGQCLLSCPGSLTAGPGPLPALAICATACSPLPGFCPATQRRAGRRTAPAKPIWPSPSREVHPQWRQSTLLQCRDLVNGLETETRNGRQGPLAEHLTRMDFIVLDELGYLPFAQCDGQLLFRLE